MKIAGQDIEVVTTPSFNGWVSIAYLPDGSRVASASWDSQAGAENEVYKLVKERIAPTPTFDPSKDYSLPESEEEFDAYADLIANDDESVLEGLGFTRYDGEDEGGPSVKYKYWHRLQGDIDLRAVDLGAWLWVKGYVWQGDEWVQKTIQPYYPNDPDGSTLAEVVEDADVICRGVDESEEEFDAREYMLTPELETCTSCHRSLVDRESVIRVYVPNDEEASVVGCLGHYTLDGDFEPDTQPDGDITGCDLRDDSDSCAECGWPVGKPAPESLPEAVAGEEEEFDPREYMLANEGNVEAILVSLGFEKMDEIQEPEKMYAKKVPGYVLYAQFSHGAWYVNGSVWEPVQGRWMRVPNRKCRPDQGENIRDVVDAVEKDARGELHESAEPMADVVEELKRWYDEVAVYPVQEGKLYRLHCTRSTPLPPQCSLAHPIREERLTAAAFRTEMQKKIAQTLVGGGLRLRENAEFVGQSFKNVIITFGVQPYEK